MVYATAPQGYQSMPQHPYHSQYAGAASNPQAEQHHSAVRPSPPAAVRDQGHRGYSNSHHHINQRFKAKEYKYSGSDEEVLQDFIDAYMATAEDYRLSAADKLQLFHNLFRGDALRFYYAHVKGRYSTFAEAFRAVFAHFNSADVQQRVKADLMTLSLAKFSEKHGGMPKGLSSLANYIANRTPQCPPSFRSELNKIDYLKQEVIDQPWARDTLVRISPTTQFQSLYTELANALQLHEEVQRRSAGSSYRPGLSIKDNKPFIYFTQPRVVKSMTKAMFPGNEHDTRCWNCGLKGHRVNECDKELDLKSIAAKKADYYAKKGSRRNASRRVLFELVNGISELCELDDEKEPAACVKPFFGDLLEDEEESSSSSSYENESPTGIPKDSMFTDTQKNPESEAHSDSDV